MALENLLWVLCVDAGFVRSWPIAVPGGGLISIYRLTLEGHRTAFPESAEAPPRSSLNEIAPSRVRHTLSTADAIVHTLAACHERGVKVQRAVGDGRLTLEVGEYWQQPDFHFQLGYAGKTFNLLFEIDNATEPLDSRREQSIRTKILGYQSYQDWVTRSWNESGRNGPRLGFRVIFLTLGTERANQSLIISACWIVLPQCSARLSNLAPPSAPTERGTESPDLRRSGPLREIHARQTGRFFELRVDRCRRFRSVKALALC